MRMEIFRSRRQWELMGAVARRRCHQRPDDPHWFVVHLAELTLPAVEACLGNVVLPTPLQDALVPVAFT